MSRLRTPVELIQLYWQKVWNEGDAELIREICGDPITRHDPGKVTKLSHDEQIARVLKTVEEIAPVFDHEVLLGDDTFVTSVWNMRSNRGDMSGIEVFKAENGRLTHCWNSTYTPGRWG